MSSTIDERVVEMRFDNQKFEKNAKTTMKTLEALDKSLELKGSTKGFQELEKAAKSVDLSHLEKSLDFVANKFTFFGKIGDKVITDLSHKFTNFFEKIAKSFTTDQIKSGWEKYEAKTNAVQVIMHATGLTIDEVSASLENLTKYTDETSYRFDQMVDAISKFTAAGVELEDAELMAEGIANWAASAGVNPQKAAGAFYNLAQAVSSGSLRAQDWKSIELLNMNTEEFEKTAIRVAQEMIEDGRASEEMASKFKKANPQVKGFRDSLSSGWFDQDVMREVFKEYGDITTDVGREAFKAAREAKTFTDAVEAAKDAVSSGWATVFEQIFGNYEEAKVFWTEVADEMIDVVSAPITALANFLKEWHKQGGYVAFINSIRNAWAGVKAIGETIGEVFRNIFPAIDPSVWVEKTKKLEEATKRWASSLTKVEANEELQELFASGDMDAYLAKLTEVEEHNEAVDKKLQPLRDTLQGIFAVLKLVKALSSAMFKIVLPFTKLLVPIANLVGVITGALGRVASSIADAILNSTIFNGVLSVLAKVANVAVSAVAWLGEKLAWLIDNVLHIPVIETFVNMFKELGEAIRNFASPYIEKVASAFSALYQTLSKFISENLSTIIEGIGKALQYIGGVFIYAAQTVWKFLKPAFSAIGNIFKSLYNSIKAFVERQNLAQVLEKIGAGFTAFCDAIGNAADVVWNWLSPAFTWLKEIIEEVYTAIQTYLDSTDFDEILDDIAEALTNFGGAVIYAAGAVWDWLQPAFKAIADTAARIWARIKVLADGIKNYWNNVIIPSGVLNYIVQGMKKIASNAKNLALSLVEYIKNGGLFGIYEWVRDKFREIWYLIRSFNFSKLIGDSLNLAKIGGILAGILALYRTTKLLKNVGKFLNTFPKALKAYSKGLGIKRIATSILMLAGALYILSLIPEKRLWGLIGALAALGGMLVIFAGALAFFTKSIETTSTFSKDGKTLIKRSNSMTNAVKAMLVMAVSMLVLAFALKKISDIEPERLMPSVRALVDIMLAMGAVALLISATKTSVLSAGIGLAALALGILLMVFAIDKIKESFAKLEDAIDTITAGLWILAGIIGALAVLNYVLKNNEKATYQLAAVIASIGAAILLLALSIKLIATVNWGDLGKAGAVLLTLIVILGILAAVAKALSKTPSTGAGTSNKNFLGIAATIVAIGVAILLLVSALKSLGNMDDKAAVAGLVRLGVIMALLAGVLLASTFVGNIGGTFVGLAAAIAIIVLVLKYLASQDWGDMLNATAMLAVILTALGFALRIGAKVFGGNNWSSGLGMALIIVGIAGAIWILSTIDWGKALGAAIILTEVLLALGASFRLAGSFNISGNKKAAMAMVGVIIAIVGAIWILSYIPFGTLMSSTLALGGLLVILAHTIGKFALMSGSGGQAGKVAGMLLAIMIPIVLALSLLMGAFKLFGTDVMDMVSIAGALAILIPELAFAVSVVSSIRFPQKGNALKIAGAITAILLPVVLALAAAKALIPDPKGLLTISTAIAEVITSLIVPFTVISLLGKFVGFQGALEGSGGFAIITAVMGIITGILAWIGSQDGALEKLQKAVPIAQTIGETIGALIGGLVGGIIAAVGAGIGTGLAAIGAGISSLGGSLQSFMECIAAGCEAIDGAPVDSKKIEAIGSLAKAMFVFASAEFIDAITNLINILPSLLGMETDTSFADEMTELGNGLQAFSDATSGMSAYDANKAKIAADALSGMILAASELGREGGWWDKIVGKPRKLGEFAKELGASKEGLETFVNDVVPVLTNDSDLAIKVQQAADVIGALADAAGKLGREGGWIDKVVGEKIKIGEFAADLGASKEGFLAFAKMAESISGYTSHMDSVIQIIDDLATVAEKLGTTGGWLEDSGISSHDVSIPDFLGSLLGTDSGGALGLLTKTSGSLLELVNGDIIDVMETEYKPPKDSLASIIAEFAKQMSVVDLDQLQHATDAMRMFFGMLNELFVANANELTSILGTQLSGEALTSFMSAFNAETLSGFTTFGEIYTPDIHRRMAGFVTLFNNLANVETLLLGTAPGEAIKSLAYNLVMASAFVGQADSNLAGIDYAPILGMLEFFSENIDEIAKRGEGSITTMLDTMVQEGTLKATETADGITDGIIDTLYNGTYSTKFFNAGVMLVQGFRSGIESQISSVERMATTLSERTITAMRRALRIESPSKVMRQIGDYTGEGYYLGLQDWLNPSATAGQELAYATTESVLGMLDYIQGIMNGDLVVDMRIRPVLDLSEVRLGFGRLDSMFSQRQAIMAQINAEDLNHRDEVAELVDVSWRILKEIQNGRVMYLDGRVVADSVNRRLGHMEDIR